MGKRASINTKRWRKTYENKHLTILLMKLGILEQKHYDNVRLGQDMSLPEIKKQTLKRNLLRMVVMEKLKYWDEHKLDENLNITYSEVMELEEKRKRFSKDFTEGAKDV